MADLVLKTMACSGLLISALVIALGQAYDLWNKKPARWRRRKR